ncbi:MAG: ribose 5-phosphate isomerase B [Armatimonadetes bacterium]|nr:ribose 5-phosphate isomerase B [Armatimonadota bacterium]
MRVVIGSDHGGYDLKQKIVEWVKGLGFEVVDFGTHSTDPVDYPDIALLVARAVANDSGGCLGILVDGAGIGSAIAANKVPGVRAAPCYCTFTARNSREHNDANVLTLGSRVTGEEVVRDIVKTWLSSSLGCDRHARRVEKVLGIERRFMKAEG